MGPNNSTPAQRDPVTERRISLTQDSYRNFSAINIALSDPVNFVLSAPALQSEVCSHLQLLFQHLPCCHDQHTLSVRALSSGDIESCATSGGEHGESESLIRRVLSGERGNSSAPSKKATSITLASAAT